MNLPNDFNSECAVISALTFDDVSLSKGMDKLVATDFYDKRLQTIFSVISEMYNNNNGIDVVTIINKLTEKNLLGRAGGEKFINEVSDIVMSGSHFDWHSEIVLGKSQLRSLMNKCTKIITACQDQDDQPEEIVDNAQKEILSLSNTKQKPFFTAPEVCERAMKVIEYRMTETYSKSKIISGIPQLDDIVQLEAGQVMIIDGRTSNGKTVLALQYAMINCIERNKKVAVFSMEMMVEYLAFREISRSSSNGQYYADKIPHRVVKNPKLATPKQREIITDMLTNMAEKNFVFDHTPNQTGQQLLAKCTQIKHLLNGLDLVVVDYMQLMRSLDGKPREQQVSEFSKAMKMIATAIEVPVIALSQVNADGSARESRAIEHDTDVRLTVFIPRNNDTLVGTDVWIGGKKLPFEDIPENLAKVKVKKNRHGILSNDILCEFDGDHQQFKTWDGTL